MLPLYLPGIARFYSGYICIATCEEAIESSAYLARNRKLSSSQSAAMQMQILVAHYWNESPGRGGEKIERAREKEKNVKNTKGKAG